MVVIMMVVIVMEVIVMEPTVMVVIVVNAAGVCQRRGQNKRRDQQ